MTGIVDRGRNSGRIMELAAKQETQEENARGHRYLDRRSNL